MRSTAPLAEHCGCPACNPAPQGPAGAGACGPLVLPTGPNGPQHQPARLDALEQRVLHEADDQELAEITAIRHRAAVTRRILTPGRDLAARTPLLQSLPGATGETPCVAVTVFMLSRRSWK
jgi:hypothetical protein